MGNHNEVTLKGLMALSKTVSLFDDTNEIKLYLSKKPDLEIIKGNGTVNEKNEQERPATTTSRKHYILVK